jgi:prevent-host-death family protein
VEQTIGAVELRRQVGRVLRDVTHGDKVVVERNGEPIAAVVPIEVYEQWKRRRDAFFDTVEQVAARSPLSEVEAQALVSKAVTAVRTPKSSVLANKLGLDC